MKKRIPNICVLLVIAASGIYYYSFDDDINDNTLSLSGNIEVTDVRLGFKIPGMLESRLVEEGDHVDKGQLIARLEDSDQRLALRQAQANLEYAGSVLKDLEAGSRDQEIAGSRSELNRAKAGLGTARVQFQQARSDRDRFKGLYDQGSISLREYEVYNTQYKIALNARKQAQSSLETARQHVSLVEEGVRPERLDQARSRLKIAREGLRQAELHLEYTRLYFPSDGVVLSTSAHPGEYLIPGSPVITAADLSRPWLRAYVNETDLGRIKLNQPAEVMTDTYPDKTYTGRISFISSEAEFTPKSVQTHRERVKLMYRIKIMLENPKGELKPGMPADALIKFQG